MESASTDPKIKEIIASLGWTKFCEKRREGVLQVVKEFYVNLEERVEDKVFLRGKWIYVSSEAINNLISAPEHEEDDYSVLMEEGLETSELVVTLCQQGKEVIPISGKNNQYLNFHAGALQPRWIPLFKLICSRLIATTLTSHATFDRVVLLYAMIQNIKANAKWIILNNMIDSIKPSKALWFLSIIT